MKKVLLAAALALAGAGVATLIASPVARAYTPDQLPGLGYSVAVDNLADGCHEWSAGYGNAPRQLIGNDCSSDFQAKLDAFVAATCPCVQTTTAAAATLSTSTVASTDAVPTTTGQVPVPPPPPTTVTTTATVNQSAAVSDLQSRVATLEAQIADLQKRVDALVTGQTVTLFSRTWTVQSAKSGLATLVAKKKLPGEGVKPRRKVPSAVLVPLLSKK